MSKKQAHWKINLKLFIFLIGTIIFVSLVFRSFQLVTSSIFDPQNRITIVLASQDGSGKIVVFSLNPKEQSISLLIIPEKTEVTVAGDFGNYTIGSVYRLGNLSSKKNGGELLGKTIQGFLGVPIDGWAITKYPISNQITKDSISPKNALYLIKSGGLDALDTNLTMIDILRMWYVARAVTLNKIEFVDLEKLNALQKTQLLDSSQVYKIDPLLLDPVSSDLFLDSRVLAEKKIVEIINGTTTAGLGARVARLTNNMGAQVLFVKTSNEKIAKSTIFTRQASYTAQKLGKSLGIAVILDKNRDISSDIQILLGEDY